MEILWNKQPGGAVWWPKTPTKPFFALYAINNVWTLYIGHPLIERIPIAEVTDINQPPLEYAKQIWGLRCG